jgi:Velvet factor
MMTDFNIEDDDEVEELHSKFWVVYCRLVSVQSPRRDMSTLASTSEDGQKEIQRLLLGTAVASPFLTKDDPDPDTMPLHPISDPEPSGPPSPTSRFLPSSRSEQKRRERPRAGSTPTTPATFFIFADISVRKAGEYRLEFSLMKMEHESLSQTGYNVPILHTIASSAFKVVNAKDFDQVQPSTGLVRGLVERGAGFPLKLKKGVREGQRRRGEGEGLGGGSQEGESSGSDEDSEE